MTTEATEITEKAKEKMNRIWGGFDLIFVLGALCGLCGPILHTNFAPMSHVPSSRSRDETILTVLVRCNEPVPIFIV